MIIEDGEILSLGVNAEVDGARLHAEEIALRRVDTRRDLSRATMYATLEPCNGTPFHQRRHCCEQIADRGVGRVVILRPKHQYEGGAQYIAHHGASVESLSHEDLSAIATTLAYGFPHKCPEQNTAPTLLKLRRRLLRVAAQFPAFSNEERRAIKEQLQVNI